MEPWQIGPWPELDAVFRLIIAALIGGIIGLERERAEKPAGFRTHLLVCLSAALITIVSIHGFGPSSDPSRVAAGIVVGVGFLGAGTIMRGGGGVMGLTTAATIWMVAAAGLAAGAGLHLVALTAAAIALAVLRLHTRG